MSTTQTTEKAEAHTAKPKLLCRILGHDWGTYGWTGDCNWPTHGKECHRCKTRIPWDYSKAEKGAQ